LTAHLRQLEQRGLLEVLLDRLEAYKTTLPLEHAEQIVTSLLDVGDALPDSGPGMFSISPSMQACRVIHWFLAQESDPARRLQILRKALSDTEGLALTVRVVSLESGTPEKRDENPDFYLVDVAGEQELQAVAVAKIEAAARNGELAVSPQLAAVLFRWRDWAGIEAPRSWSVDQTSSAEGFLTFLCGFVGDVHVSAMGSYASQTKKVIRLGEVETFVDEAALRSGLEAVGDRPLNDREAVAVEALRTALSRRDDGKSDDDFWD
jgi:hypothetical protein